MSRIRRWGLRLGLAAVSTVLALLLAEGILRLAGKRPMGFGQPRWYYTATDYGYDINPNIWPPMRHRFLEGEYPVWSNSLGCFEREPGEDFRPAVLLVGDSFTWGYTPFPDKWGTVLERVTGVGVLKCGVSGYGTRQALLKARRLLRRFPETRLVIYTYCLNDLDDDYLYPHFTVLNGYRVNKVLLADFETGKRRVYSPRELRKQ